MKTPASLDLRRAAEYHEGRRLTETEVGAVLDRECAALIARWTALGRWLRALDAGITQAPLSGVAKNAWGEERRQRQAATMRAVWAARRAQAPPRPLRPFGSPSTWATPEQKVRLSAAKRASWARRKANDLRKDSYA